MDVRSDEDIVVVGGGLAGAALAGFLARAGRSVSLLEKDRFPRDKLCGEFLSPESQSILARLDSLTPVKTAGAPAIRRARFTAASGRQLSLTLPGEGLGVSRYLLDATLFDRARALGAVASVRTEVERVVPEGRGFRVHGTVREEDGASRPFDVKAGWVIGTYGRRGRLDHQLKRAFITERHPYLGLKRHHRPKSTEAGRRLAEDLTDHVEIHAFDGGYCGMSFIETGEVNVCMLLESRIIQDVKPVRWAPVKARLLSQNPMLAERLEALEPSSDRMLAVAEVPFSMKRRAAQGILFAGDAAGMIAPLAGDGQAMALSSAFELAHLLWAAPRHPSVRERQKLVMRWRWAWRRRFELRMRLSLLLQSRLLNPKTADRVIAAVGAVPGGADALARWTRG